jgi:8-oxo-dGTP pyrophosphatase MutT (NUDIX family)
MRTIHRDCVVGLIFSADGKLLMGMKDPHGGGVYADCWHIPGGGIDENETQTQALRREMGEEVGIDTARATVTLVDYVGSGESKKTLRDTGEVVWCNMKFYYYRIELPDGADAIKVRPGDDLQKITWVDIADLPKTKYAPPSAGIFTHLGYL